MTHTHEIAVEAHGTYATLYLSGTIGVDQVTRAILACERLPRHIRALRIDWQAPDGGDSDLYHLGRLLALWYARGGDGAWTVAVRPGRPRDFVVTSPLRNAAAADARVNEL